MTRILMLLGVLLAGCFVAMTVQRLSGIADGRDQDAPAEASGESKNADDAKEAGKPVAESGDVKQTALEKKAAENKKANKEEKKKPPVKIDPNLGILTGRVKLKGKRPAFENKIEVASNSQNHAFCLQHVKDERVVIGKHNELKDAVVSVEDYKPKRRPEAREAVLDNKGCLFVPHVLATTVGSTLTVTNSDAFIHNTHGLLLAEFNQAISPKGTHVAKLRKAGWGLFVCDFHPWMRCHIHVFPHDLFDITEVDGTYKIVNIPPGTYKVRFWAERLQKKTLEVTIEAGKTTRQDAEIEPFPDR